MITGAQGGHPDTAAGAKCTIVIAPLLQGRIPAICTRVTTVTTPGETVDVVITDYGIAINPRRQDLIECMKDVDLPFCTIEELRDKAYAMVGEPDPVQFDDRIVGVIEARDGTIIDVVRQIKEYEFSKPLFINTDPGQAGKGRRSGGTVSFRAVLPPKMLRKCETFMEIYKENAK